MIESQRRWVKSNPDKVKITAKRYRDSHRIQAKEWRIKNKLKIKEKQKIYHATHRERENEKARERHLRNIQNPEWIEKRRKKAKEVYENKIETDPIFKQKQQEKFKVFLEKVKNDKLRYSTRFRILCRDKFTCRYCGRKAPEVALHVDHIFPKSKGGTSNDDNLITSCFECNLGKGALVI